MIYYYLLAFILIINVVFLAMQYKKCPKGRFIVVYNYFTKTITNVLPAGKGVMVVPLMQGYTTFPDGPIVFDLKAMSGIKNNKTRITVTIIYTVEVSKNKKTLKNAIIHFPRINVKSIIDKAKEVVNKQLYANIANLTIKDISGERLLIDRLNSYVGKELKNIGLELRGTVIENMSSQ